MEQEKKQGKLEEILVVDDLDNNRFMLRDIIQEMGCRPILAENGVQALKIVERFNPQLIILDVAMPEMDGYEFCKIMKENAETRDIPIIFISAFDSPADIVQGFNLGGEDYITKPFIPEVVKERLKLHLKLRATSRNLMEVNRLLQSTVSGHIQQLELERKNVLYALVRVARENACYDKDHMERICYNCRILAGAMQLSPEYENLISDTYVDTIEIAAPLCDLGNVAIPTDILQKKEMLTPEEIAVIQTHTTIGAKILRIFGEGAITMIFLSCPLKSPGITTKIGTGGYPCGKKGEEIPLAAQIVSVVSAYCAMTENRVYREPHHIEETLEMMEADAGTKFNPRILGILRKIYRQLH